MKNRDYCGRLAALGICFLATVGVFLGAARPAQASFLSLHVAVTDLTGRTFRHQTLGLRERLGVAWVNSDPEHPLQVRLPGTTVRLAADGTFSLDAELTDAQNAPLAVHATLASPKPVTLHGAGGYSRKGDCPSCASHYASFPRLRGSATVRSSGGERSGQAVAWFDHEFGSNVLSGGLTGWDWLALQLDDGWELMAAQTHDPAGRPAHRAGTLVAPDGKVTPLGADDLTLTAPSLGLDRTPLAHTGDHRFHAAAPAHAVTFVFTAGPDHATHLRARGFVVYLRASIAQQMARLARDRKRPLLQGPDKHCRFRIA